jgi:hypothetical protein
VFAVIHIKDKNNIFTRSKIESVRHTLPNGEAFFTVRAEKHFGRVPWQKLESCMGILRKDVLISEGVTLPKDSSITEFVPDIYPRIVLMNSAVKVLSDNRQKSLIVFDERCIYTEYIRNLVRCFDRIKVITPEPETYDKLSAELMEDCGFSLEVSDKPSYKADAVIAYNCSVPLYFSGKLFTAEKKFMMNAKVYSGGEIDLPDEYEKIRPDGVSKLLFASALYEKCKVKVLGNITYKDFNS